MITVIFMKPRKGTLVKRIIVLMFSKSHGERIVRKKVREFLFMKPVE